MSRWVASVREGIVPFAEWGALSFGMGPQCGRADEAGGARVVGGTAAGGLFGAAGAPRGRAILGERSLVERLDPLAWVGRWVLSVRRCEKPVIAAVNGPAVGAGFGLALACDVRLVASTATMAAGYVRRGLSPDAGVSYFLPRHGGAQRAADILFTGRNVSAEEADR